MSFWDVKIDMQPLLHLVRVLAGLFLGVERVCSGFAYHRPFLLGSPVISTELFLMLTGLDSDLVGGL